MKDAICKRCNADPKTARYTCKCGRTTCVHLSVVKVTPGFFGDKKHRICGPCNLAAHRAAKKAS